MLGGLQRLMHLLFETGDGIMEVVSQLCSLSCMVVSLHLVIEGGVGDV